MLVSLLCKKAIILTLILLFSSLSISCSSTDSDEQSDDSPDPGQYIFDFGEGWHKVSTDHLGIVAVKTDGSLWEWRRDQGTRIPFKIDHEMNWKTISISNHILAIKEDGTLWAWGENINGELGDGTTESKDEPIKIGSDSDWKVVESSGSDYWYFSIGLKEDGTLWAWGANEFGQLGNGNTESIFIPTQIGDDTDWEVISSGGFHTVALKTDGSLWAWGANEYGQLGDGSIEDKLIPIQIGNDYDWYQISSGGYHTMALKRDNTLWTWGGNFNGQLGDGTTEDKLVPIQISTATNWEKISAGITHSVAIKTDGSLWDWGLLSLTGDSLIPKQFSDEDNWVEVSASTATAAIGSSSRLKVWGYLNDQPIMDP